MSVIRYTIDLLAQLLTAPLWLVVRFAAMLGPDLHTRLFQSGSQTVALLPGDVGNVLRRAFYRRTLAACSSRCVISFGTIFSSPHARIGDHVYIGAYCSLGECVIDDDCLIGSFVSVLSGKLTHRFDRVDIPMRLQGGEKSTLRVGPDAWIGNSAIVLTDIAPGVVVGAGSVVTRPPDPMTIVAGNPAKFRSQRGPSITSKEPSPANLQRTDSNV